MNNTTFDTTEGAPERRIYKGPFWVPIDLAIGVIECIACFICLIYSIYIFKKIRKSVSKSFMILTISCLISFVMTALTFSINGYYYNTIWWKHTPMTWNTWSLGWLFWAFGQCLSYILFINRLQLVFDQTVYKLSMSSKIYLYIIIFTYIILWIGITCVPLYFLNVDTSSSAAEIEAKQFWDIQLYFSFIMSSIDTIITISMIYMFISRLYKLLLERTINQMNESPSNNNQGPKLTFQHTSLINVSIKVSILSITSLISSVITVSLRGLSYYVANQDVSYTNVVYAIFNNAQVIWLQIDTVISSVCIVLFLPETTKVYKLVCCCFHKIMSKCYKKSLRQNSIRLHRARTQSGIFSTSIAVE